MAAAFFLHHLSLSSSSSSAALLHKITRVSGAAKHAFNKQHVCIRTAQLTTRSTHANESQTKVNVKDNESASSRGQEWQKKAFITSKQSFRRRVGLGSGKHRSSRPPGSPQYLPFDGYAGLARVSGSIAAQSGSNEGSEGGGAPRSGGASQTWSHESGRVHGSELYFPGMGYLPEHLNPYMSQDETYRVRRYKRMMLASVDDVQEMHGVKKKKTMTSSARRRRQQMKTNEEEIAAGKDAMSAMPSMSMMSMMMMPEFVDGKALTTYLTERGGMQPRRRTGFKVSEQRKLKKEVRIARQMGVLAADRKLPYLIDVPHGARGRRAATR